MSEVRLLSTPRNWTLELNGRLVLSKDPTVTLILGLQSLP